MSSAADVQQVLDYPQTVTKETVRDLISELKTEYRTDLEEIGVDKITRELNSGIDTEAKKNYLTVFQYQHLQKVEEERNYQAILLDFIQRAQAADRQIKKEIKNPQDPYLLKGLEQDQRVSAELLEALIKDQQKQALLLKLSDAIARESVILQKRADLEERRVDEFLKDNPELNKQTPELSRKAALERINQFDKEYQAAYGANSVTGQIKALGKLLRKDAEEAVHLENQANATKNEVVSLEKTSSISYEPTLKPTKVKKIVDNSEKQKQIAEEWNKIQKYIPILKQALEKLEARYPCPSFGNPQWIEEKTEELNIINHGNSRKFSPTPKQP